MCPKLKIFVVFTAFLLLFHTNVSADFENSPFSEKLAGDLKQLRLFVGVSDEDFDLYRPPTRLECLVMLVRMLGKESESKNFTHPFSDVPTWAEGYVGYAYEKGLTKGVSDNVFGADIIAGANTYLTFVLRALGYSDENGKHFTWENPYALAAKCGILPKEVNIEKFFRSDAVIVSYAALTCKLIKSDKTLAEYLITENAFTKEQYDKYIDNEVFLDSAAFDKAVSDAIIAHETREDLEKNRLFAESHIILDVAAKDDIYKVSAVTAHANYYFTVENDMLLSHRPAASCHLSSITLKKNGNGNYETVDYWSFFSSGSDPAADIRERFSDEVVNKSYFFLSNPGPMYAVCDLQAEEYMESDEFRFYPPTFEESLAKIVGQSGFSVIERLDAAEGCAVIYGVVTGYPHTPHYCIYLICQDGRTKQLPLPAKNGWGTTAEPESIYLSDDKSILYYSITFDEKMVIDEGLLSEKIIHEEGTYSYTVDISTGEVDLVIIK